MLDGGNPVGEHEGTVRSPASLNPPLFSQCCHPKFSYFPKRVVVWVSSIYSPLSRFPLPSSATQDRSSPPIFCFYFLRRIGTGVCANILHRSRRPKNDFCTTLHLVFAFASWFGSTTMRELAFNGLNIRSTSLRSSRSPVATFYHGPKVACSCSHDIGPPQRSRGSRHMTHRVSHKSCLFLNGSGGGIERGTL